MEPRGWECGLRKQGAPQNLHEDCPAYGIGISAPTPVTSVTAPDSWRPKSISRSVLCWGRVSRDPRDAVPRLLSVFFPKSGLLGVPLPWRSQLLLWVVGWEETAPQEQLHIPLLLEGRKGVLASSHNFGVPQPTFLGEQAAPVPSLTPGARLPRGPHKAHGSPAAESHRCPAPGPCAQPRSPSRSRSSPAPGPRQRWQLQFKCFIKASPGEGRGRAGRAPLCPAREPAVRRGARDGERASAPGRSSGGDWELQPARRARVRHYLALRLSFDWSNGAAPPPPPRASLSSPRPAPPRHRPPCGAAA